MERTLICAFVYGLLFHASARGEWPDVLSGLPSESTLVAAADLSAWGKLLDSSLEKVMRTPAVTENSEIKGLLEAQKASLNHARETLKQKLGTDPMQGLGWAAASLIVSPERDEPDVILVVEGRLPADLVARLRPGTRPETISGREVWRLDDLYVAVEGGRRVVAATRSKYLAAVLESTSVSARLKERLPELVLEPRGGLLLRLSFSPPEKLREAIARKERFPAKGLLSGLAWLQLDIGQSGITMAVGCGDEVCQRRASMFLDGLGEFLLAEAHAWRAYGFAALGLDLSQLAGLPPPLGQLFGNRPALEKSLSEFCPPPDRKPTPERAGLVTRLRVPDRLSQGGIFFTGVAAAVAIPSFINYVRRVKETEAHMNLRQLALMEEQYYTENGHYLSCGRTPEKIAGSDPVAWPGSGCFSALGFSPSEKLYFSYETVAAADGFQVIARCDLDGDGVARVLRYDFSARRVEVLTPQEW